MAMSVFWLFSLASVILLQNEYAFDFPKGTFTEKEAVKLEKEADDIEERIKVYRKASERMMKSLLKAVSKKEFQMIPDSLSSWTTLLAESLNDIEANLERKKKKSKPLIKYEIQVRKAIKDIRDFKTRAPVQQQDIINRSLDRSESVRARMVEILFNPEL
jgi:hypothetical protein